MSPPSDFLTAEELNKVIARKQFIIQVLTDRISALTLENVELMSIVQELQRDLAEARQVLSELHTSEETLTADRNGGEQVSPGLVMPKA